MFFANTVILLACYSGIGNARRTASILGRGRGVSQSHVGTHKDEANRSVASSNTLSSLSTLLFAASSAPTGLRAMQPALRRQAAVRDTRVPLRTLRRNSHDNVHMHDRQHRNLGRSKSRIQSRANPMTPMYLGHLGRADRNALSAGSLTKPTGSGGGLLPRDFLKEPVDPYRIVRRVLPAVSMHGAWAAIVAGLWTVLCRSGRMWSVQPLVHTLTGSILGLLLAFRTNQAYGRYWSACNAFAQIHRVSQNMARLAAQTDFWDNNTYGTVTTYWSSYASIMRHLMAFPIALKQWLRGTTNRTEYHWPILHPVESETVMRSPSPHLVILGSLTLLIQPLKSNVDFARLTLWGELERRVGELQEAAAQLNLIARLPIPQSYTLFTSRFVALWVGTLPFVLVNVVPALVVPIVTMCVAWALYSTDELARLLDQPFGAYRDYRRSVPETVPLDNYVDQIVQELKQQATISTILRKRVVGGRWTVTVDDLVDPVDASVMDVTQSNSTDTDSQETSEANNTEDSGATSNDDEQSGSFAWPWEA